MSWERWKGGAEQGREAVYMPAARYNRHRIRYSGSDESCANCANGGSCVSGALRKYSQRRPSSACS